MAFKKISMFASLVVVTIISYNVQNINAQSMEPLIDQDFNQVKAALFELQEAEYNVMNDSQKLNDMQKEYFAGKVDYSAVERARNELIKSKSKMFVKFLRYLYATNEFEPTVSYQNSYPQNLYRTMDDLNNYKNFNEMPVNLGNAPQPPTIVV
ncbi:uncharacterized protein LOC113553665 [Rhopalosiphum maidis]|uniref:uncharacterized protein LOC113553665 n=1 Tax=Rhopalosiphum maidis TaxID=43146 RepID=UPI000F00B5D1|nr:uncharacterized protein LOC113553665 [Rhopalosiphum maidis]